MSIRDPYTDIQYIYRPTETPEPDVNHLISQCVADPKLSEDGRLVIRTRVLEVTLEGMNLVEDLRASSQKSDPLKTILIAEKSLNTEMKNISLIPNEKIKAAF